LASKRIKKGVQLRTSSIIQKGKKLMKVVTLLNEKGGVGKTTLSVHLAAGLARRGKRVVLVDTDAQANATHQMKLEEDGTLYQLLVKEAKWSEVLRAPLEENWSDKSPQGSLWMVTSNLETRAIPMLIDDATLLRERLLELEEHVDVVIIDTSPTPSLLHSMIYLASDYMVYPTQAEILSMVGLGKSVVHMQRSKDTRKAFGLEPTHLLGVQPTMFQPKTAAHQHGLGKIVEQFGDSTWIPLTQRTIWREAAFARQTIFSYAPGNPATKEIEAVVDRVEKGIA
jgi:chromosome partitioning protein